MKKKSNKYSEGDLFLIGNDNQNSFLGLIARRKGRTKLLLGYFWKANFEINENLHLRKEDVILISKFSGLGFEIGDWEILGKYSRWEKQNWVIPEFKRYDRLLEISFAISYNENMEEVSERKISNLEAEQFFEDGSHGYKSLESYLKNIE